MARVKKSVPSRARRAKILKLAKGYRDRTNCFKTAKQRVQKAMQYNYRDRRVRRREFRALWIIRINAALRSMGLKYSVFMGFLKKANIDVNRKMLANMALHEPVAFEAFVKKVQAEE